MALVDIVKVRLYSHNSYAKEVLGFLQEKQSFEIIAQKEGIGGTDSEYMKADLAFAIKFLSPYANKKGGIRGAFLGDKIEVSKNEAKKMVAACDWKGVVKKVKDLEVEKNDLVRSIADIAVEINILEGWEEVEVMKGGQFEASFFRIHQKDTDQFESEVSKITDLLDVEVVSVHSNEVYYSVIAKKSDMDQVQRIMQEVKGEEITLPEGKVQDRVLDLRKQKKAKEAKLQENKEVVYENAAHINGLKASYDYCESSQVIEEVMQAPQELSSLCVLEGWMVKSDIAGLQSSIEKKWSAIDIEEVEPEEGEKPPVMLKNNSAMSPFEVITGMYGAPQPHEIDPTPFLSVFFVIFFGLCLTDAAYGMILTVAMAAILISKMPIDKGMKEMIKLLLYAGLSTVFFGILFGGWFGIDPNASFIPEFLTYAVDGGRMFLGQVVSPAKDLVTKIAPLVLLGGVLHLLLGVVLSGYVALKNNNKWDAFMVALPTFITIGVGVLMALTAKGFLPAELSPILKNIVIGGFAVMTVGIMKSGGPIQWFMDVTGWLSNTLSYARLFALGLATGVVAQVFNTVAFTIGGMMPTGLDIVVIIVIILFGHTLNIALNLLGAFVHSGRLQFVEFFGQFLEGGGRYFAPMKKSTRYIYSS